MKRTSAVLVALLAAGHARPAPEYGVADLAAAFAKGVIVIEANSYACYRFDIFVAETDAQKQRGLMYVRKLPDDTGMLFIYRDPDLHAMWMKNTYIPLDMLFIRGDGQVSSIARNTEPLSLRSIRSVEPVNYVLELNAGVTERLSIDSGSLVVLD
jgi:uncharacterized membrane protein (UPF0127 family)